MNLLRQNCQKLADKNSLEAKQAHYFWNDFKICQLNCDLSLSNINNVINKKYRSKMVIKKRLPTMGWSTLKKHFWPKDFSFYSRRLQNTVFNIYIDSRPGPRRLVQMTEKDDRICLCKMTEQEVCKP